jgi:putative sigma-54 modulation protein
MENGNPRDTALSRRGRRPPDARRGHGPRGIAGGRKEGESPMNITITFRHMVGTEAVKRHVHEKVAKLQKFLRQAMTAQVTLAVEGLEHVVEVGVSSGSAHFHATERSEDMYASIDMVLDKLERQIRAAKGAVMAKKRGGTSAGEFAASAEGVPSSSRRT